MLVSAMGNGGAGEKIRKDGIKRGGQGEQGTQGTEGPPAPSFVLREYQMQCACGAHTGVVAWTVSADLEAMGECLPGAHPPLYFSINYPAFIPRFTLSWRRPPSMRWDMLPWSIGGVTHLPVNAKIA